MHQTPRFKYARTMINWLLVNDLAENAVIGYDMGCSLNVSLGNNSYFAEAMTRENITLGKQGSLEVAAAKPEL
jgi:hypothetical protein